MVFERVGRVLGSERRLCKKLTENKSSWED